MEGPEENAEKALEILKKIMSDPFRSEKLLIKLEFDAKICNNWYESK